MSDPEVEAFLERFAEIRDRITRLTEEAPDTYREACCGLLLTVLDEMELGGRKAADGEALERLYRESP